MRFLLELAWRDLRASGRSLWVFCACLALGVALVSASGGLYRLVSAGLLADTRELMGGDLEVDARQPLPAEALGWMRARGEVSLVTELYTMLGTADGSFLRVELQSMDANYPLYGRLRLEPDAPLAKVTAFSGDRWGVAVDRALAARLGIGLGDRIFIGALEMEVRALIVEQPDRNLTADWRGPPVLLTESALDATGLIQPGSRVDYDYHVATDIAPARWRSDFYARFPDETWEVRTFEDRSERIAERLGQIASGLLIIAFSTLFIGGLGVFNSIRSYLQRKLGTIATLRALGLRNRRLAAVYLLQVGMLAGGASLAGCVVGSGLALLGAAAVAAEVPIRTTLQALPLPNFGALLFGLLTAYTFALPAIGRALAVPPAILFRDGGGELAQTPRGWWFAAIAGAGLIALLVVLALPDWRFGIGFVGVVALLLILLDGVVRGLRRGARRLDQPRRFRRRLALRLALANLHRPGTPLRASLLSLGSALTLIVACTLVVASLLREISLTIPAQAPALILYDINSNQLDAVARAVAAESDDAEVQTAPLVRTRLVAINGRPLTEHARLAANLDEYRDAVNDDFKLSYRDGNIDNLTLVEGAWWDPTAAGPARLAFEDREARRLGVGIGDRLTFAAEGRSIEAEIAAIHRQKGLQTRFWFEGILSEGALGPLIHRHVGTVFMDDAGTFEAQRRIARVAPNVVSVPTASLLATAQRLLGQASAGLAVVAAVSLAASLLVLASVMAAGRSRQVYDATVLNTLGARMSTIRRSLLLEYLLLALITSVFALALGAAIALPLLHWRLKLPGDDLLWLGLASAVFVSSISLGLGARYLMRRLRTQPAALLRAPN